MAETDGQVVELEVAKIAPGKSQARQRNVKVDEDLLLSIQKNGLIQPIVVFPHKHEDYEYEVVVGQRRLMAHQKLNMEKIRAIIRPPPKDEYDAKALSLIENIARQPVFRQDYTDACDMFYNKYRTTKAVAEELGISTSTVRKYLKLARLPKEVQEAVNDKEIGIDVALKSLDFLGGDETAVDAAEVLELAKEMKSLSPNQKKKVKEIKTHEPEKSVQEVVAQAKTEAVKEVFSFEVTEDQVPRIKKYQDREKIDSQEDAATELIDIGLEASDIE